MCIHCSVLWDGYIFACRIFHPETFWHHLFWLDCAWKLHWLLFIQTQICFPLCMLTPWSERSVHTVNFNFVDKLCHVNARFPHKAKQSKWNRFISLGSFFINRKNVCGMHDTICGKFKAEQKWILVKFLWKSPKFYTICMVKRCSCSSSLQGIFRFFWMLFNFYAKSESIRFDILRIAVK